MTGTESRALGLLIWLVVGIVVAHICRRGGWGTQILIFFVLTKGFVCYWLSWGLPSRLIRFGWHCYKYHGEWRELCKIKPTEGNFFTYLGEQERISKDQNNQ